MNPSAGAGGAPGRPVRGWHVSGAAGGLQFMQAGLLHQGFGAYLAVLNQEMGWSRSALAGAAAMQSMESALLGPVLGWIIDRFGPRMVILIGVLLFGAGFMLMSQAQTLPGFYVAVAIIAVGSSMCGFFPLQVTIIRWFDRGRARALSIVGMGLALGGTFVPVVAWSLVNMGWRFTAFASGVMVIVIGVPLARIFWRGPPASAQMPAAAVAAEQGDEIVPSDPGEPQYSARQALRTRAFWLLAIGHALALFVVMGVNVHAINHMSNGLGYRVEQASLIIMLVTIFQIIGVLIGGIVGDRMDKRLLCAGCMVMHAGGMFLLTFASAWWMLVAFAMLHGTGWGLRGPLMQAIRADYFGRKSIGMILGLSSLVIVVGQVGGALVAGITADLTGDYRLGFFILATLAGIGSWMFLLATKPTPQAAPSA